MPHMICEQQVELALNPCAKAVMLLWLAVHCMLCVTCGLLLVRVSPPPPRCSVTVRKSTRGSTTLSSTRSPSATKCCQLAGSKVRRRHCCNSIANVQHMHAYGMIHCSPLYSTTTAVPTALWSGHGSHGAMACPITCAMHATLQCSSHNPRLSCGVLIHRCMAGSPDWPTAAHHRRMSLQLCLAPWILHVTWASNGSSAASWQCQRQHANRLAFPAICHSDAIVHGVLHVQF
jgi:hypothetical protein